MNWKQPSPDTPVEPLEARRLLAVTTPVDADPAPNNVPRDAAEGTPVGVSASASADDGAAVSYALADDAGGRFAIDRFTGVVTVALAAMLAGPAAHTITVRALSAFKTGIP